MFQLLSLSASLPNVSPLSCDPWVFALLGEPGTKPWRHFSIANEFSIKRISFLLLGCCLLVQSPTTRADGAAGTLPCSSQELVFTWDFQQFSSAGKPLLLTDTSLPVPSSDLPSHQQGYSFPTSLAHALWQASWPLEGCLLLWPWISGSLGGRGEVKLSPSEHLLLC